LPGNNRYDFTDFSDTRFEDDVPLAKQLCKELKKILYSHHKSAKEFYDDDDSSGDLSIE